MESPDKTSNIHFGIEHTKGGAHQVGLMSPRAIGDTRNGHSLVREDSETALGENASNIESKGESSEHIQLTHSTSKGVINNLGEKFSKEIEKNLV